MVRRPRYIDAPDFWNEQSNHPGRLHKQNAQVAIALLRNLAKDRAVYGRYLPWH
jgi:hypothetical protein